MIVFSLLLGRLVIWVLQTSPVFDFLRRRKFFNEMLLCDFCTGFWVFLVVGLFYGEVLMAPLPWNPITWVLNALLSSYIMHLISLGWEK